MRLTGHAGPITSLVFMRQFLVSASTDTLVKTWDLDARMCIENTAHRSEVTAIARLNDEILITGCADSSIRIWKVSLETLASKTSIATIQTPKVPTREPESLPHTAAALILLGTLQTQTKERILTIKIHQESEYIAVQGADRTIELLKIKTEGEIAKMIARRKKRARKAASDPSEDVIAPVEEVPLEKSWNERFTSAVLVRCSGKVRSFDFAPSVEVKIMAALSNNSLEVHSFTASTEKNAALISKQDLFLDLPGHRSDIRTVALSSDDALVVTGSNDLVKVWNIKTGKCLHTMPSGYALCSTFLPGNNQVLIGTKTGTLELYDLSSASMLEEINAHSGPVWTLDCRPDKLGVVTGSADKTAKFWDFSMIIDESYSKTSKRINLVHTRTLKCADDVLALCNSPNNNLIALALLDMTIQVFYTDSLKFSVSLYGHKLPAISLSISFDSKILISASSDKTVKIWGLEFGDCHRSLSAGADSIMSCKFVWGTYFFVTASKDRSVRYWCAEKFEEIQRMDGHAGEVWGVAVGKYGNIIVSVSHDRSIRVWEKSDEQVNDFLMFVRGPRRARFAYRENVRSDGFGR